MELREGYKHTEVPIIPEDWEEINLDGLVKNNGLIRGPFGGSLKKEIFVESGIKIYEQKNAIYQNVEIGTYFINEEKYKELNRFEVFENDFILSCSGTIGRIFRIPQNPPKGIINQALLIIRLNNSLIDFDYFYYQAQKYCPDIQFEWVKGHENNEYNNIADKLAVEASHEFCGYEG